MNRYAVSGVVAVVSTAAVVIAWSYRPSMIDSRPLLPMTFAHADHRDVNCVLCHHNFTDDTGSGLCIDCHKTNVDIRAEIEPMFHTMCRDCHVSKHADGEDAGPVRQCKHCHTTDEEP
jgi:hypothetical protein